MYCELSKTIASEEGENQINFSNICFPLKQLNNIHFFVFVSQRCFSIHTFSQSKVYLQMFKNLPVCVYTILKKNKLF